MSGKRCFCLRLCRHYSIRIPQRSRKTVRLCRSSIVGAGDTRVGVVLIVDNLADVHDILGDIGKEAYLLLGTLVLLVLIVMVIISKVFTEPVKNLIDVIRKMSEGHFEQRAKVRGIVHNEIVDRTGFPVTRWQTSWKR